MLAMMAFEEPISRWRERRAWASPFIIGLLVVNSLTSVALTGQVMVLAANGDFRISRQELEVFSWLDHHSQPNDLVIADYETSNHLPQYTHNPVFCGYGNTVHYDEKSRAQLAFFQPDAPVEFRADLIEQNRIRFLLATPKEAESLQPQSESLSLNEVFRNDAAVLYAVLPHQK
jgi:hypothetical protein